MHDRGHLLTELRNDASTLIDRMSIEDALALLNREDEMAVAAVGKARGQISAATRLVASSLRDGGRLFYVGAGTSGRLGVLDAAECPPTFLSDPQSVQGIIAGGFKAMVRSIEGAEDDADAGQAAIIDKCVSSADVVMGIAAGGTTPFVHAALRLARQRGARTIFLTCVASEHAAPEVDVTIRLLTGPEVITGSTRMKAGTATKLTLNAISTIAMVQLGKVYENLMVDLADTCEKLRDRAARIIMALTDLPRDQAERLLANAGGRVKVALVMNSRNIDRPLAEQLLAQHQGRLHEIIQKKNNGSVGL